MSLVDKSLLADHVDAAYFDWLMGRSQVTPAEDASQTMLLGYLADLAKSDLAGSDLIPRIPGIMQELLKNMRDENVSSSNLALLIKKDVVLLVAVLKAANSAIYNPPSPIIDLNKAIQVLGHNGLRLILAKTAARPIFNAKLGDFTKLMGPKIWEHTEARSIACSVLAKQRGVDQFQAFLAGLMQDVGLMIALRVFERGGVSSGLSASESFRKSLRKQARTISAQICRVWDLVPPVPVAISEQDSEKSGAEWSPLGQLLRIGDFIGKACVLIKSGQLQVDCLFTLVKASQLD